MPVNTKIDTNINVDDHSVPMYMVVAGIGNDDSLRVSLHVALRHTYGADIALNYKMVIDFINKLGERKDIKSLEKCEELIIGFFAKKCEELIISFFAKKREDVEVLGVQLEVSCNHAPLTTSLVRRPVRRSCNITREQLKGIEQITNPVLDEIMQSMKECSAE